MRIVSLLPSATEVLAAIGAADLLVGRSHECDYPPSITDRPILTSQRITATTSAAIDQQVRNTLHPPAPSSTDTSADTSTNAASASLSSTSSSPAAASPTSLYELDHALLASLQPDVILTQDLCAVCSIDLATVRALAADLPQQPQIVALNPVSLFDVFDDLLTVGEAIGRSAEAERAMVALRGRYWEAIDFVNPYTAGPEVAFLEWMDPLFAAGHWTPQLIHAAGGSHSLNPPGARSRQMPPEELLAAMPDRLIICPCGYDLPQITRELSTLTTTQWWPLLPAVQDGHIALVDGNQMFNRPGPRLVDAMCWLTGWLNDRPNLIPADFPVRYLPLPTNPAAHS